MARARYLVVTALTVALAGCGGDDDEPSAQQIEANLVRVIQEKTGTGGVVMVDCPEDVQEGDICDVTAAGGVTAKVQVTRLDDADVDGEVVQP